MYGVGRFSFNKSHGNDVEKVLPDKEQQAKVQEMEKIMGPVAEKLPKICGNASLVRYLKARNWSTKKVARMLKDTVKWRLELKPAKFDGMTLLRRPRRARSTRLVLRQEMKSVLVMRPGFQNTNSSKGQIRYLVYCMESAIGGLTLDQDQMDHYPERLDLGILYNPPENIRVLLEDPANNGGSVRHGKAGGRNPNGFNYDEYAKVIAEDERKRDEFISPRVLSPADVAFETESTQADLSVQECEEYEVSDDIGSPFCEETALAHSKLQTLPMKTPDQVVNGTKDPGSR